MTTLALSAHRMIRCLGIAKEGAIFVANVAGQPCVFAIDTKSNHELWEARFEGVSVAKINILGEYAFVFFTNGRLHVLDLYTGRLLCRYSNLEKNPEAITLFPGEISLTKLHGERLYC